MSSETITRNDLTNILNEVLPAGGGGGGNGLTRIDGIDVTAHYESTAYCWTFEVDDITLLDAYIPVVACYDYCPFPFSYDGSLFALPEYVGLLWGIEDSEQYTIDVWCIAAPV